MIIFAGCTKDGFNRQEIITITEKSKSDKMKLATVNLQTDSIFLRREARKVAKRNITSKTMSLFKSRMLATVSDSLNPGVGIAAPQVGVSLKMILVQRLDKVNEPFEVYFNPKIERLSDSINSGLEGCLSVPGYHGKVERSQNIEISYLDSTGNKCKEEISGFTAVIFQHEIDHLLGILYFDHIYGGFNSLSPDENKK
jgi:peptide deformylase